MSYRLPPLSPTFDTGFTPRLTTIPTTESLTLPPINATALTSTDRLPVISRDGTLEKACTNATAMSFASPSAVSDTGMVSQFQTGADTQDLGEPDKPAYMYRSLCQGHLSDRLGLLAFCALYRHHLFECFWYRKRGNEASERLVSVLYRRSDRHTSC